MSVETRAVRLLLDEPEGHSRTAENRDGDGEHRNESRPVELRAEPQSDEGDNEDDASDTDNPLPLPGEKGTIPF